MAFKIELLETGIQVTDTNNTNYIKFLNPSNIELTINNESFGMISPEINQHLIIGTFDNIRKDDDSTPTDFQDALDYLSTIIYAGTGGGSSLNLAEDRFFDTTTARDAAIPTPEEGEFVALLVPGQTYYVLQRYDGSAWENRLTVARGPRGEAGDPTTLIDDTTASTSKTYSSTRIVALLDDIIDDTNPSTGKVYSSTKVDTEIDIVDTELRTLIDNIDVGENDDFIILKSPNLVGTDDGNWRIIESSGSLIFSRRESGVWVDKGRFSNSLDTDEIFIRSSLGRISIRTDTDTYNLVRETQSIDGTDVADMELDTFISSRNTIKQAKYREQSTVNPLQPLATEVFTGSVLDFEITNQNFGKLKGVEFQCDNPNGRVQVKVYRDSARTQLAYFSSQDEDFINGEGLNLGNGLNNLDLSLRPLYFSTTAISYVTVSTLTGIGPNAVPGELSINGATISGQFIPRMLTNIILADIENLATEQFVIDAISATGGTIDEDEVKDIIGATVQQGTGIDVDYDSTTRVVTISATGGTIPPTPEPQLSNFAIDIQRQLDVNAVITGEHIITYNLTLPAQVQSLNLTITGITDIPLTVPVSSGSQSQTITLPTLVTSIARTINFQIVGVSTDNTAFHSNVVGVIIRAFEPHEFVYYGVVQDISSPSTIDLTSLNTLELTTGGTHTLSTGPTILGDYFILLTPSDHEITRIEDTVLNQDVKDIFSDTPNARTINAVNYIFSASPRLRANDTGEDYIITFS